MRSLDDLIDGADDGWLLVERWRSAARQSVDVVGCERTDAKETLLAAQVTTRSPMGAIALHCGAIVVAGGWLRILGSGNAKVGGGLREWNSTLGGQELDPPLGNTLVVAYDAVGGFFVLNGGRWAQQLGGVHYLAPDGTGWQALGFSYSGLVEWSMSGDLDRFYAGQRWAGWQSDVSELGPDCALSIYPPLCFNEVPLGERAHRSVPARELWTFHHDLASQLANLSDGAQIRMRIQG